MTRGKLLRGLVLATLTAGAPLPAAFAETQAPALMSEEEIAAHRARMAELDGPERDAYRSAQYEILKQRAHEQGYALPATPPWQESEREQAVAERREMLRQAMDERRKEIAAEAPASSASATAATTEAAPAAPAADANVSSPVAEASSAEPPAAPYISLHIRSRQGNPLTRVPECATIWIHI